MTFSSVAVITNAPRHGFRLRAGQKRGWIRPLPSFHLVRSSLALQPCLPWRFGLSSTELRAGLGVCIGGEKRLQAFLYSHTTATQNAHFSVPLKKSECPLFLIFWWIRASVSCWVRALVRRPPEIDLGHRKLLFPWQSKPPAWLLKGL